MRSSLLLRLAALVGVALASLHPLISSAQAPAAAPVAAQPFAQTTSDLKADPAARFGTLPNGLRYVVLANPEPRGRASLRLLVEAGSLHETEAQRGLAHFLEHMAFNGSTHYPPGTLVEFFQRMGMNFGGDTNASTGFDRTLYLLELADTKPATLTEGLKIFADYAGGLLLQDPEIDHERGVILSEKRVRDNVGYRTFVAQFNFVLGDTLFPKRMPIGLTDVIEKAPRAQFIDFYDTWYRPELMAVVAVGDFDPAVMEQDIIAAFSPVKARAPARAAPDLGKITEKTGLLPMFHPEPESPNTSIGISTLTAYAAEPDTAANRLKNLPRDLAASILNRRFAVLAKKEDAAFLTASLSVAEQFNLFREASLDLTAKADQWAAALAAGEQELRRALEHGFTQSELAEVRATYLNALEQAVKTAPTRRSPDLAGALANSILHDEVFTHPADDLALFKPALEKVTTDQCLAALRATWSPGHRYLLVSGNAKIPGDPAAAIVAAYEASRTTPVAAPAADTAVAWAYTDFGPAGKVVKRDHVADLETTLVTFANGVRLNLKKTAFEAGRVRLTARIGDGTLTEPADRRGLASLAGATFDAGGLGKHSADDLRRILAGKNVGVGFRPALDAFEFSGSSTPDDLLLQLQLLTAKITDPGYRPESLRQARKGLEQMFLGFQHTANGPLSTEIANLIAGGDPRFGVPPKEILLSRTLDEVKTWLTPHFATGAIEIALVGDLDIDAAIDAVARTLGALPARSPKALTDAQLHVLFPSTPFAKDYVIDSQIPKGLVRIYWPTTDGIEAQRGRRLNMLGNIVDDRLRIKLREEMGGTYSPSARSSPSDIIPGYGFIVANVDTEPAAAQKIAEATLALADDLAKNGVTQDELDRARLPILTSIRESVRSNGYWADTVLRRAQERPQLLDYARNREADIIAITKAELDELAKTYLAATRASRVIILPATTPTPPPAPTTPGN